MASFARRPAQAPASEWSTTAAKAGLAASAVCVVAGLISLVESGSFWESFVAVYALAVGVCVFIIEVPHTRAPVWIRSRVRRPSRLVEYRGLFHVHG